MIAFGPLLHAFAEWFDVGPEVDLVPARSRETLLRFAQMESVSGLLPDVLFDARWYASANGLSPKGKNAEVAVLGAYLRDGVPRGADPTEWFDERYYREVYPDVARGIASGRWSCGYEHYLTMGLAEHRSPNAGFNELAYVGGQPDVLQAIRAGIMPNGWFHFACMGRAEHRTVAHPVRARLLSLPLMPKLPDVGASQSFAEGLYLSTNRDVQTDGAPGAGMRHWLTHGIQDDAAGTRPRVQGYIENVYLRENPDIAHFVGQASQPSGYHHFLMYGAVEGRRWSGQMAVEAERAHLARALSTRSLVTEAVRPTISVIVPVYNPAPDALAACIDSVLSQTWPAWELCLADDGSSEPETAEILEAAARRDHRVKIAYAARNSGISAASNLALAQATGEFVALLDHDDLLAPDALLHVARAFLSAPDVDMVYTDEAKLAEDGTPIDLNPKPGWSPDLLLSTMYIGHLTAYRATLLEALGGFRSVFDGTQDYDLALRAAERVRRVVHVPLPLYFWRLSPTSTAGSIDAKPGVLAIQAQALESALIRRGQPGAVLPGHGAGHWRVVLDPPGHMPLVSVVIPTAGRMAEIGGRAVDLVATCIRSIAEGETYPHVEYVVVHNNDLRAETMLALAAHRGVRLVAYDAAAFNLSDKINLGVRAAAGEFVLLLNDDMQALSKGLIGSMLGRMYDGVGIVGGQLLYANGTLQHAGIVWTSDGPTHAMIGEHRLTSGPANRLRVTHDCFGVSGACMFFQREVFLELGGFAPHLATNYNDVNLCLKVRAAGLRVVFNPDAQMFHFESLSKVGTYFWELQLLLREFPGLRDPYLNPVYSGRSPFYELRDPAQAESPAYRAWLLSRIEGRRPVAPMAETIRFSIIMSVYQNRRDQMRELAATIVNQTYLNWEWVIVDDGSTKPETLEWLEAIRHQPGVRFIRLDRNQGIMAGYGAAFRAATGDYVVPVDADDFLTLDCLQVLAAAISAERAGGHEPDALYSDEDKASESSSLHSPFLKPDWDPVLFTNVCFTCHVAAIKRATAEAAGCYTDDAAAWCHDWDTFWRIHRAGGRIVHVPEVLYSWRIHPGSTASMETANKPHTITSQKHVLDQHLRLGGLSAAFEIVENELFPHNGIWRLRPQRKAIPRVCILLVASGFVSAGAGRLSALLLALARGKRPGDTLMIVDATDSFWAEYDRLPPEVRSAIGPDDAKGRRDFGLADAVGFCVAEDRIAAVVDTEVASLSRDWLYEGAGLFAAAPDVAAVGGQVFLPDGRVAWQGGFWGFGALSGSPDHGRAPSDSGYHGMSWCQRSCDAVSSVCFFVRPALLRDAAVSVGPGPLSLRAVAGRVAQLVRAAGERIVYTPLVTATLARVVSVDPVVAEGVSDINRGGPVYYHAAFGRTLRTAYALAPVDQA